ncbi:Zinc finger CCCH domain-containing protein 18 [Plecturocebus cupreus]
MCPGHTERARPSLFLRDASSSRARPGPGPRPRLIQKARGQPRLEASLQLLLGRWGGGREGQLHPCKHTPALCSQCPRAECPGHRGGKKSRRLCRAGPRPSQSLVHKARGLVARTRPACGSISPCLSWWPLRAQWKLPYREDSLAAPSTCIRGSQSSPPTCRKRQLSPQSKSSSKVTSVPGKASDPSAAASTKSGKASTLSRREELLKQLKAVEDAIARKRAKIPGKA